MEFLQLALILMGAILVSAVLEPLIPRVSLPLVQVVIGVLMYFLIELPAEFTIESDLFLVLLISPLLFDESKNANNRALWNNKGSILSLAIGLVLVTALVIGFVLNLIVPSVPLAAAFALGAALGPTDAVAVASLSKEVKLNSRQSAQLTGEALLNDASGVVSFQFAIAAAITGAFSVAEASVTFLIEFLGGIAIGVVIAVIAWMLIRFVRRAGVESATFHVCYEIFLPFFSYIAASSFHASGILAVVACGLVFAWMPDLALSRVRRTNPVSARISIASGNVWSLLSFVLNGVIFTYLGFKLPGTISPAVTEMSMSTPVLCGIAVLLTAVTIVMRFVWILLMDFMSDSPLTDLSKVPRGRFVKNALVTTLAGPKGAVSLSIAMTIPYTLASGAAMPVRDFLLFLVCAVIILTLLLANFVVPVLSPADDEDDEDETDVHETRIEIQIVDNVIAGLRGQRTEENRKATFAVIRSLNERKASLQRDLAPNKQLRILRQGVLAKQEYFIHRQLEDDSVDKRLAERYLKRISKMRRLLKTRGVGQPGQDLQSKPLASSTTTMTRIQEQVVDTANMTRKRIEFKIGVERVAVEYLEQVAAEGDPGTVSAANALITEHKPLLVTLENRLKAFDESGGTGSGTITDLPVIRDEEGRLHVDRRSTEKSEEILDDVRAEAFRLELDEIQTMSEAGKIPNSTARDMREEIYLQQMALAVD